MPKSAAPAETETPRARKRRARAFTTATVVSFSLTLLAGSVAVLTNLVPLSALTFGERIDLGAMLFVAPVLVLTSLALGPAPMDLAFPAGLVLIILLSVLITAQVAGDGRSDWLKGVQLLAVYLVLAITFFFVPVADSG